MTKEIIHFEPLEEGHWARIADRLAWELGRVPDPLEIRAAALISALGLPSGEMSALGVDEKGERVNSKKDRIIAEYLANKPGVLIDKVRGIVSTDFRDMYPDGLPGEIKRVLDRDTLAIMESEYEHAEYTRKTFANTEKFFEADTPVYYFRLPGGIDLFSKGYIHVNHWQERHKIFLQKVNKNAKVICIEGVLSLPFGRSMQKYWFNAKYQQGYYDALMHEAVDGGFNGFFAEVDARDMSQISMDCVLAAKWLPAFPDLPDSFFQHYFDFLKRERLHLAEKIGSQKELQRVLAEQSITPDGIYVHEEESRIVYGAKQHYAHPYLSTKDTGISFEPSCLELGQKLFTDALAAIKLHLIAKLMADGHFQRGPIIDYEGEWHLSSKSFFLRYPGYAMDVVLRTINELMAGRVKKAGNVPEIYAVFQNPDWAEIIKEIVRLEFEKVEDDPTKTTALGPNQRKLFDYPLDFLQTYGIDPKHVMLTDKEIQKIRKKISTTLNLSTL